ncbi:MAG TPA: methionyl-tRNA formyltransferase [Candidatus Saccharimonadales bacterium]|nr:methionyl-tRNA formyltransferase [Candidatus Saccharimonadales bacterium]
MRILFCGTPHFAVPTFIHLLAQPDIEIAAVITQPDRPRGRGGQISASPLKDAAIAANVPVHQPEKIRSPEARDLLAKLAPDCIVIIAYGQIIPTALLTIPKLGWINLHASLLPKYRGAAPINWAIANGETQTGLTTMRIDAGMDTGNILLQEELDIAPEETAPELAASMAEAGAPLMLDTLRRIAAGNLASRPQNNSEATYAPLLKKEDGRIDWNRPAQEIYNRMRGFDPWPGAYSSFRGQTCHLWAEPFSLRTLVVSPPGSIVREDTQILIACGRATLLRLLSVKLEGRKQISSVEFANGARLTQRERFDNA